MPQPGTERQVQTLYRYLLPSLPKPFHLLFAYSSLQEFNPSQLANFKPPHNHLSTTFAFTITMVPRAKTYILAPGWDLHEGSVQLGSIITNPLRPQLAIFKPPLEEIDSRIHVSGRDEFNSTVDTSENSTPGLFSTFLSLFGLGDEPSFHYDRKHVLSYSFRKLHMRWFSPSDTLKHKAVVETDRVAQFCRAGNYKIPVYMVTGLKTISGAGVTTTSSRGNGWRVQLSVGASSTGSTEQAEAELEEPQPVVFAFQLTELRLSPGGEIASANFLDKSNPTDPGQSAAALQQRLDKELGETAFAIMQGLDEEDGTQCEIISPSTACVDLLTASSAKIPSRSLGNRR
ncbi:hypothetical protein B0H67DRAFT_591875 [Lasiosphaeris hirsuta]|uniref:Uncharacterized protein n=1 Tax=Lasiosphaeris hirsuta TaxID=260670 RepID=A0AA40DIP5_9PEZI|nr:hypothetical protein B0H67DRAFT_591875 [Lasiosphaeris hirsuta]